MKRLSDLSISSVGFCGGPVGGEILSNMMQAYWEDKAKVMTENEYIRVSNLAKIRSALAILREVMCGDEHGVSPEEFAKATTVLYDMTDGMIDDIPVRESGTMEEMLGVATKKGLTT